MKPVDQKKVFELEVDAWCYGLAQYPGEMYPELVHAVIRELHLVFIQGVRYEVIFDIMQVAEKIARSSKYLIPEKELVFSIMAQLPSPKILKTEGELYTLAAILDKVEKVYNGAISRFEKRWNGEYGS